MAVLLILLALIPVLIALAWHLTSSLTHTILAPPTALRNKRIILLIAHPDDEAMFFAPTLQALTAPSLGNHLKILCLSTGDAEGLGPTRSKELVESALLLGVRKREDVFVMDDPRFRDGMQNAWRSEDVCRVLGMAFAPQIVHSTSSSPSPPPSSTTTQSQSDEKESKKDRRRSKHGHSKSNTSTPTPTPPSEPQGPRATIDVLVTFDAGGVSGHPNHIVLHSGARAFLSSIMRGHSGWACPVTLYTLPSVNIARKYSFIIDALTTLAAGLFVSVLGGGSGAGKKKRGDGEGDKAVFINDMSRYWAARRAMVEGHKSQMVWFRWGWISLGRYMVVNDLKRERVAGA